ncbi:hypothetical protein QE152_g34821 [Popillia japonica]|uniref:Reverse transcriptase domain-containing protein n=1 Tax=Popillia japonica TaxID=7064 RepID=A0AAW1ITC5_POPJA
MHHKIAKVPCIFNTETQGIPSASYASQDSNVAGSLYLQPVTTETIITTVRKLSNKKSHSEDEISNFLLKNIIECIAEPLEHIFNCSMKTGIVPKQLKQGIVIPIHKKGLKTSTDTAIYSYVNEILSGFENKQKGLGLFVDLTRAFDSVQHEILLAKLYKLGIRGVMFGVV